MMIRRNLTLFLTLCLFFSPAISHSAHAAACASFGTDTDGDGVQDMDEDLDDSGADCDDDDSDRDGVPNYLDIDDDGDGIPTAIEGAGDPDGDFRPNYLDTDSDGDGLSDQIEGEDENHDGVADRQPSGSDTDGDGLDDTYDHDNGGTPMSLSDHDDDGIPDYLDDIATGVEGLGPLSLGASVEARTTRAGVVLFQYRAQTGPLEIRVFDARGRAVSETIRCWHDGGVGALEWNSSSLARGVYFVRLRGDGQRAVSSFGYLR